MTGILGGHTAMYTCQYDTATHVNWTPSVSTLSRLLAGKIKRLAIADSGTVSTCFNADFFLQSFATYADYLRSCS